MKAVLVIGTLSVVAASNFRAAAPAPGTLNAKCDVVPCGANLRCDWITDPNHLDWPSWQQCVPADSPANYYPHSYPFSRPH